MTNTEIIINALKAHGTTDGQLSQILDAYKGDLPFHTIPEWSRRGYHVKDEEKPLFDCYLWKHTSKPGRAAIEAAQAAGEEVPEHSPHFYKKLSYIYSFAQVEKNAAAPDLASIKARFGDLPGLVLKVKGEKTGAPNVWFTGDVEKYADEIKAAGGIWSKKKAAYWVKPSAAPAEDKPAAPVPSMMEDAPAAQVDKLCTALVPLHYFTPTPVHKPDASTQPAGPAPATVPHPWKKCSFYTIRKKKGSTKPTAHKVDGYTDGIYNYYSVGTKSKTWHVIHPVYGLSIVQKETRQAAQARALELSGKIREMEAKKDVRLVAYADIMKAAQDGGNLSLF